MEPNRRFLGDRGHHRQIRPIPVQKRVQTTIQIPDTALDIKNQQFSSENEKQSSSSASVKHVEVKKPRIIKKKVTKATPILSESKAGKSDPKKFPNGKPKPKNMIAQMMFEAYGAGSDDSDPSRSKIQLNVVKTRPKEEVEKQLLAEFPKSKIDEASSSSSGKIQVEKDQKEILSPKQVSH